jgi:hypothetical protein
VGGRARRLKLESAERVAQHTHELRPGEVIADTDARSPTERGVGAVWERSLELGRPARGSVHLGLLEQARVLVSRPLVKMSLSPMIDRPYSSFWIASPSGQT